MWKGSERAIREHAEALSKHPPKDKPPPKPQYKKRRGYCLPCLLKMKRGDVCPKCGKPLKFNTNRVVSQVLARAKTVRGLRRLPTKPNYSVYLQSELWKTIRARVLKRDGYQCAACGGPGQVVHHRSYDQPVMAGEDDSKLVSLCDPCHERIEFDVVNGVKIKNGLAAANAKLDAMCEAQALGILPTEPGNLSSAP